MQPVSHEARHATKHQAPGCWRWKPALMAAVAGAALYLGAGAAQAQVTTFAEACIGKSAGTQVSIGPFYTGDASKGASTWTVSPGALTPGYSNGGWVNIAKVSPAQPNGADWIAVASGSNPVYTYTLTPPIMVDPGIVDPASISVTGFYAADNYLQEIEVGASAISISNGGNHFGALRTLASDAPGLGTLFQAGENTLSFVVRDQGAPSGLYANVSVSGSCVQKATVAITKKADTRDPLSPGNTVDYTVTVTNTSTTTPASQVLVNDQVPAGIDPASFAWTCDGAYCPALSGPNSGPGPLNESIVTLPALQSVIYTITGTAESGVSSVINTATVTGPDMVCDDGGPQPCMAQVSNPFAEADMRAAAGSVTAATVGQPVTVDMICTNAGDDPAVNPTCEVSDAPVDATIVCTPDPPVTSLGLGESITCSTTWTPTSAGEVTLVATAGTDTIDPNRADNTAKAIITVAAVTSVSPVTAAPVPTLTEMALLLLAAALGLSAAAICRRGR